jgi:AraC-like DNA-binding protein
MSQINPASTATRPPFQVRTVGRISEQPHHSSPGTKQGDVMLTAIIGGRGRYILNGQTILIEAGTVGLVGAEVEIATGASEKNPGILLADPQRPYDHYYCRFSGSYARQLAAEILRDKKARFFQDYSTPEVADLLRRMGHLRRNQLPVQMGRAELLLAEVLLLLSAAGSEDGKRFFEVNSLNNYLLEHLSEPFELAPVADYFNMSRAALCRATRRVAGKTVLEIAEELKIDWAQTLLTSGTMNVSETALRVGYQDPFYFSKVFKKRVGLSPRQWLQAQTNETLQ